MASLDDKMKAAALTLSGEQHRQKQLTLSSTGRHILISYPEDLSDGELMDFLGWLTNGFRSQLPPVALGVLRNPHRA